MNHYTFHPRGVCARAIEFNLDDDGRLHDVRFIDSCHGNSQGIGSLVEGMPAQEVMFKLSGIRCERKQTSCPDQFSRALKSLLLKEEA